MRVIDLLNKIANGEEVPKKIKVGDYYYEFYERLDNLYNYKKIDIDTGKYFDDYLCDTFFLDNKIVLNWGVEIIEEEPRDIEDKKIEYIDLYNSFIYGVDSDLARERLDYNFETISKKINEIIDHINKEK